MSLLWSTSFATLLDNNVPADAPLAALGTDARYASLHKDLLERPALGVKPHANAPALELPWPAKDINWFWCRYLEANPIRRVKGKSAFYRLVPLRRHESPVRGLKVSGMTNHPQAALLQQAGFDQVSGEAWFHPHMVSFALSLTVKGEFTPTQMAQLCLMLRNDRLFQLADQDRLTKLDELAAQTLDSLLLEAVGKNNAAPVPPVMPFTIVTVLQGASDDLGGVAQGDEVHIALENLTRWREGNLGNLADGDISHDPNHAAPPPISGGIMFGRERARVVWDPPRFASNGRISLSCYHRNILVSTLQTEALLVFMQLDNQYIQNNLRPKAFRLCETSVLKHIAMLHQGDRSTYRSASLRRFIDDHPMRPSVNAVAEYCNSRFVLPS
jgi:hypothetical protein